MSDFIRFNQSLIISIAATIVLLILIYWLLKLFNQIFLFYKQSLFKKNVEWTFLELKIPREVLKTPRAMEQFFINLHTLKNSAGDWKETYVDGEVPLWWSFEIASFGGKIHFYIRTPKKHKKIVETSLYAQYPNIEVFEVKDYLEKFPLTTKEFYESNEDIFGSELILKKPDFYPIITYEHFFEQPGMIQMKDEIKVDPLSTFIESLASLHKEENMMVQILAAPVEDDWKNDGKSYVDKKMGRSEKKKSGERFSQTLMEWIKNLFMAPVEYPKWTEPKEEKKETPPIISDYEDVKAIENKLSKNGFESLIRYLYISPKPIFNMNFGTKGIISFLNQYAAPNLNIFTHNYAVWTLIKTHIFPYFYHAERIEARKQRILYNFRNRTLPEKLSFGKFITSNIFHLNNKAKNFILVTSELATIYHIPGGQVLTSPYIERIESKKMGPPAGLPIFEE